MIEFWNDWTSPLINEMETNTKEPKGIISFINTIERLESKEFEMTESIRPYSAINGALYMWNDLSNDNIEESKMTTMDEKYGDGSDCIACNKCGRCIECGDCKCNQFKETKPFDEIDHVELTIQIDGFPYNVRIALSNESIQRIKINPENFYIKEIDDAADRIQELMKDRIK